MDFFFDLYNQFVALVVFHQAGGNMIDNYAINQYVAGWLAGKAEK